MSAWPLQQDPAYRGQAAGLARPADRRLWCLPALGLLGWLGVWSFVPSLLAAMLLTTWLAARGWWRRWAA
jgi:hypothetical protein